MASHATTINAVPASEGRQQGGVFIYWDRLLVRKRTFQDVVFLRKSSMKQDFCVRSPVVLMPMWWNGEQEPGVSNAGLPACAAACFFDSPVWTSC